MGGSIIARLERLEAKRRDSPMPIAKCYVDGEIRHLDLGEIAGRIFSGDTAGVEVLEWAGKPSMIAVIAGMILDAANAEQ